MGRWLRRLRGAVGMGITWAIGWSLVGTGLAVLWSLGAPLDWYFRVLDAPAPAHAVPGFFAGAFFSIVLGIAARHRRFAELSLARFAAWGAIGGILLVGVPVILSDGPGAPGVPSPAAAAVIAFLVLLSALSAVGTLLIARRAEGVAGQGTVTGGGGGRDALTAGGAPVGGQRVSATRAPIGERTAGP